MKTILNLSFLLLLSILSTAQTSQNHIPTSKSLIGIWRLTGAENQNTGKIEPVQSDIYKVNNADGTFYSFVTFGTKDPSKGTVIGHYGTYQITTDSTVVELITKHVLNPKLDGQEVSVRFKLIDDNVMIMSWSFDKITFEKEKWTRLPTTM